MNTRQNGFTGAQSQMPRLNCFCQDAPILPSEFPPAVFPPYKSKRPGIFFLLQIVLFIFEFRIAVVYAI